MRFLKEVVEFPVLLVTATDPLENVYQLLEHVAYVVSMLGVQHTTCDGHLSAMKFFHFLISSIELDTQDPLNTPGPQRGSAWACRSQHATAPAPSGVGGGTSG